MCVCVCWVFCEKQVRLQASSGECMCHVTVLLGQITERRDSEGVHTSTGLHAVRHTYPHLHGQAQGGLVQQCLQNHSTQYQAQFPPHGQSTGPSRAEQRCSGADLNKGGAHGLLIRASLFCGRQHIRPSQSEPKHQTEWGAFYSIFIKYIQATLC